MWGMILDTFAHPMCGMIGVNAQSMPTIAPAVLMVSSSCCPTRTPPPVSAPAAITVGSTAAEVQDWLHASGFDSSATALAGKTGSELLAMSAAELEELSPLQGAAIYAALRGM